MTTDGTPRISVLVPTIGRVDYLAPVRASLAAQTFEDYEILILDNGSPPHAQSLHADWASADARVRILRHEPRLTMFGNFKRGVSAARGEFVTFCHDDDVVRPRFFLRSVAVLEQFPRAAFSGTNYAFIDETGKLTEERAGIARTEAWSGERYIRTLLARGRNPITMQSVVYRRSAFGPDGFDDSISHSFGDFVILMRMAEKREVALIAETLVEVRRHAGQASNAMSIREGVTQRTRLLSGYIEEYRARHPDEQSFADELVRLNDRARTHTLLWAWAASSSANEARACAAALDNSWGSVLHGLERVGVRRAVHEAKLAERVRRLAENLGL